jgi:hypothetical protein
MSSQSPKMKDDRMRPDVPMVLRARSTTVLALPCRLNNDLLSNRYLLPFEASFSLTVRTVWDQLSPQRMRAVPPTIGRRAGRCARRSRVWIATSLHCPHRLGHRLRAAVQLARNPTRAILGSLVRLRNRAGSDRRGAPRGGTARPLPELRDANPGLATAMRGMRGRLPPWRGDDGGRRRWSYNNGCLAQA